MFEKNSELLSLWGRLFTWGKIYKKTFSISHLIRAVTAVSSFQPKTVLFTTKRINCKETCFLLNKEKYLLDYKLDLYFDDFNDFTLKFNFWICIVSCSRTIATTSTVWPSVFIGKNRQCTRFINILPQIKVLPSSWLHSKNLTQPYCKLYNGPPLYECVWLHLKKK